MTASCVRRVFDVNSLPKLHQIKRDANELKKVTSFFVFHAGSTALVYKICGAALSALTHGHLTLLGTVIVTSKLFCYSLALGALVAATAWTVENTCSYLIHKLEPQDQVPSNQ